MQWIAPSEKDLATNTLDKRPGVAADRVRANSGPSAKNVTEILET